MIQEAYAKKWGKWHLDHPGKIFKNNSGWLSAELQNGTVTLIFYTEAKIKVQSLKTGRQKKNCVHPN